jgi:hypothetical protein
MLTEYREVIPVATLLVNADPTVVTMICIAYLILGEPCKQLLYDVSFVLRVNDDEVSSFLCAHLTRTGPYDADRVELVVPHAREQLVPSWDQC